MLKQHRGLRRGGACSLGRGGTMKYDQGSPFEVTDLCLLKTYQTQKYCTTGYDAQRQDFTTLESYNASNYFIMHHIDWG